MIRLERINNIDVKPIKIKEDKRPVKGCEILGDNPYVNIMEVAPTAGGKTTATYRILSECVMPKKTIIIAFVPSIYNDENWIAIRERLSNNGNKVIIHTSLKDDNGIDLLKQYVTVLTEQAKEEEEQREYERNLITIPSYDKINMIFPDDEQEMKEEKKKSKYKFPKFLFIFDDISSEIRSKSYEALVKKARHYNILTITSSQDIKDINPATIKQMRVWLLFKGIDDARLSHVHNHLGMPISFEQFKKYYDFATKNYKDEKGQEHRHNFLYFRPRELHFRQNFNNRLTLK